MMLRTGDEENEKIRTRRESLQDHFSRAEIAGCEIKN